MARTGDEETFGERMRRLRRRQQLTLIQLAAIIGTDASYLGRVEKGLIPSPGLDSVQRIAKGLKTTVAYLIGDEPRGDPMVDAIRSSELTQEQKDALLLVYRSLSKG